MKVSFSSLLYADDTFLCEHQEEIMESLLWAIEDISEVFGLKLNRGKCQQISVNYARPIHFKNGDTVKKVETATCLGSLLNCEVESAQEINKRICEAAFSRKKLVFFEFFNKRQDDHE